MNDYYYGLSNFLLLGERGLTIMSKRLPQTKDVLQFLVSISFTNYVFLDIAIFTNVLYSGTVKDKENIRLKKKKGEYGDR
jgi:hypothetical protein